MTELISLIAPYLAKAVAGNPKAAENVSKLILALRFLGLMNVEVTLKLADLVNLAGAVGGELAKLPVPSSSVPPGTTPPPTTPVPQPPPPFVSPVVVPFPPLAERRAAILSVYDEDLNRVPSEGEIESWMMVFNSGGTREQMHESVMKSGEYIDLHTVKPPPPFTPLPGLVVRGHVFEQEG